jgi:hypothetical protein
MRHYASEFMEKKKGKEKMQQVEITTKPQIDEFVVKFEKEFLLVSCLSNNTITRSAWYLDNGASHHMTKGEELFNSLTEKYLGSHVDLGDDVKYTVEGGGGIIMFYIESGGSLEALDVLYVPEPKKKFISVSALEDKGFVVLFKKWKVLIHPKGAIHDTTMRIGFREGNIYKLQGMLVHGSKDIFDHGSMSVAKVKEQEALKGEKSS